MVEKQNTSKGTAIKILAGTAVAVSALANPLVTGAEEPNSVKYFTLDVSGKEHKFVDVGEEFTYNLKVNVPEDNQKFEYIKVENKLDDRLKDVKVKVFLDNEEAKDLGEKVEDGTLKLDILDKDKIKGKELKVTVNAKLKEDVENLKNVVKISYNAEEKAEEKSVTVSTLKYKEAPNFTNTVDGYGNYYYKEVKEGEGFKYLTYLNVPEDIDGYKVIKISNTIGNEFDIVGAKVLIDGVYVPSSEQNKIERDGKTISSEFKLGETFGIEYLAGKEVTLEVEVKAKEGTKGKNYKNTTNLEINGVTTASNSVTVNVLDGESTGDGGGVDDEDVEDVEDVEDEDNNGNGTDGDDGTEGEDDTDGADGEGGDVGADDKDGEDEDKDKDKDGNSQNVGVGFLPDKNETHTNKEPEKGGNDKLPQTGFETNTGATTAGLLMLMAGVGEAIRRKFKRGENEVE